MFPSLVTGYLVWLAVMSVITFVIYGWDKRQARTAGRRVPESRLHRLAYLGGWPGALLGQHFFRHKTQKTWFQFKTWVAAVVHSAALTALVYYELA